MIHFSYFHPMADSIQLPKVLQPFADQLMQSHRTFIRLKPDFESPVTPWESAVGGLPYWLKGLPFPQDATNNFLLLLAQINFEEVPCLSPFPQKGLLQFFINNDDLFGRNDQDPTDQSNFRIVYHSEPSTDLEELVSDFSFLAEENTGPFETRKGYGVEFMMEQELMPYENHRFESVFGSEFFKQFGNDQWSIIHEYSKHHSGSGHKIGGYPFFTQNDPRLPESPLQLLLQIDTDADIGLMWGDMGVANFFIDPEDLRKLDFSSVYFHWDCH